MRKFTRDTEWGSYDGRFTKVRDLEDTHVANIIKHLQTYFPGDPFLDFMIKEAKLRGLTEAFYERAHIPFKDDEGNWMLWSDEESRPVKVG